MTPSVSFGLGAHAKMYCKEMPFFSVRRGTDVCVAGSQSNVPGETCKKLAQSTKKLTPPTW